MEKIKLSGASFSLKILITCLVATLSLGYAVAILQIYERTQFDVARMMMNYRGDDSGLMIPPSFATLLSVAHTHTFSQPVMLFLMGLVFAFSHLGEKTKSAFILSAFVGSVVSNAAPFLIRYISSSLLILLPLSQAALMVGFFGMASVILYDLWISKS